MDRSTTPEVVVHDSKSTDLIKPTSPTSEKAPGGTTQGQYLFVLFCFFSLATIFSAIFMRNCEQSKIITNKNMGKPFKRKEVTRKRCITASIKNTLGTIRRRKWEKKEKCDNGKEYKRRFFVDDSDETKDFEKKNNRI